MLHELDTGSQVCLLLQSSICTLLNNQQVCNLIWSLTSHKLVSIHGFSSTTMQNQICIWKYPTLNMIASLMGHTNWVLYLAMSPDGETIVTGAGDETLRFWNVFLKKEKREGGKESRLDCGRLIRWLWVRIQISWLWLWPCYPTLLSSLEHVGLVICHSYLKLCTSKLCSITCLYSSPTPPCHFIISEKWCILLPSTSIVTSATFLPNTFILSLPTVTIFL